MEALGIDIGSQKTVLTKIAKGGVEIVLSDSSNRSTPSIIGYTAEERLIGDSAINQWKKNFKNTMQFFSRFVGLNTDCKEQLEEEKKFITYKIVELENKKVGFEVLIRGEKQVLTAEQILGFYLKKLRNLFQADGCAAKEVVMTVPSYFSNAERVAILDAAEIAGIKCNRLLNESTAICLQYGFFRKKDLDPKVPRKVAFVDYGHSKLTVTFAEFTSEKVKILGHNSNRNMGARQIDYILMQELGKHFEKKYGCDPRENVRCRLRMLEGIEKMRKILSSNSEASINLESLMEDEDLNKTIKRQELEELIDPVISNFFLTLKESVEKFNINVEELHSVELVGEATRTPIVLQRIQEVFGKAPSRTLNSADCIARGACLQAAMLSKTIKVAQFGVEEYNLYPIQMKYTFNSDTSKVKTQEIFKEGSSFPNTKNITFDNKKGGMMLLLEYVEGTKILQGLPSQIAKYTINEAEPKKEAFSFKFKVTNNLHQIPLLESAELIEAWEEEEKIPVKVSSSTVPKEAPKQDDKKTTEGGDQQQNQEGQSKEEEKKEEKPAEQQYEIKKKLKKSHTELGSQAQGFSLVPEVRKQFIDLEIKWFDEDNQILRTKHIRNDLESYAYSMRNGCDSYGQYEHYIDPKIRDQYVANLNQAAEWLYGEGENAPIDQVQKKLSDLQTIGEPVVARYRFYTSADSFFPLYDKEFQDISNKLGNTDHLTDEQRKQVTDKSQVQLSYIEKVKAEVAQNQKHIDPSTNLDELERNLNILKAEVWPILNTPPPKKEEPKKEETQEQQKQEEAKKEDVEMKDDQQQDQQEQK